MVHFASRLLFALETTGKIMNENWIKDYQEKLGKLCAEYPATLDMYSLKECQPSILNSLVRKIFPSARALNVLGMQRAGNHIINHWMLENDRVATVYINNATLYPGVADSVRVYYCDDTYPSQLEKILCTYENVKVSKLVNLDPYYIIRDPYNWLASWMRHPEFNRETLEENIETYIHNAENCKKFIVYNQWVSNVDYRNNLADELGFSNADLGIDTIPEYGSGSSFDRHAYAGMGSQMKVSERWKILASDSDYLTAIKKYEKPFAFISKNICEFSPPDL